MPSALPILWTLTSFLSLWGLSLIIRGLRGNRASRNTLTCPSCRKPCSDLTCSHCGYQSQSAKDFRHPRNWRLVLSSLIPFTAAAACAIFAEVVRSWFSQYSNPADSFGPFQAASIGILAFAIILTTLAYRGDRSRGRRRCPKCWYDMSGSNLLCPECGHDAKSIKNLYRPRRRTRGILIGLCLALASYGVWIAPHVGEGGPIAATPSWVLIAGMPWLPQSMILEDPNHDMDNDWSLRRRFVDHRLRSWEVHLAHWRARRLILSECSVRQLQYAMEFVEETDADLVLPRDIIVARGIASLDPKARNDAAFTTIGALFDCPNSLPGERLRPYKSGLIAALDDPVREVRGLAAWYLTELGPESDEYIPKMLENLAIPHNTFSFGLRDCTDQAIERRADESDTVLALLIQATRSSDTLLIRQCARIISSPRCLPRGGRDRLLELLHDPDFERAGGAANYLCESKVDAALPDIVTFVQTRRPAGRIISSLSHFSSALTPYLPQLLPLAQSDSADERFGVANLISMLLNDNSLDPALIVPTLEQIVIDDSGDAAELAQDLLKRIKESDTPTPDTP